MDVNISELNEFFSEAALETYAGNRKSVEKPQRPGFKELIYTKGLWEYRDSYAQFRSFSGQETIYHNKIPVWIQSYAGKMLPPHTENHAFAETTFTFLKAAMRIRHQKTDFQPRGPEKFSDREWDYKMELNGNIQDYEGQEWISHKGTDIYSCRFFGLLLKN